MKTPQCCIDCKNVKFEVVYESDGGNMNSQRRASCSLGRAIKAGCPKADPCEVCSACHVPIGGYHTNSAPAKRGNLLLCWQCAARYDRDGGYIHARTQGTKEVLHVLCFAGESLSVGHADALRIVAALDVPKTKKLELIEQLENARIFYLTDTGISELANWVDERRVKSRGILRLTPRQRLLMKALNRGLPAVKINHGNMTTWTIGLSSINISKNTVRGLVGRGLVDEVATTKKRTEYKITNAGIALLIKAGEG